MRRLRVGLSFALTPFVVVMLMVVSILPPGWQEVLLAVTSGGLILLISLVELPEDATSTWSGLKSALSEHRALAATGLGIAVVSTVFVFEEFFREKVPGQSWAGSAVQLSLLLWPFSLLLYNARVFVTRA